MTTIAPVGSDRPLLTGGAYDPVQTETTATDLRVTGRIPEWLDGRSVRNGPNPIGSVDPATFHSFMGDGMVHGVRLRGGRAEWYRNRWVRSADAAKALGEPRPSSSGVSVAANTTVIGHAGATLALVEAGGTCYALTDEGEPVFVPRVPDAAEDDGVLTGFVHDGVTGGGRLDAASLESLARVHLPVRVPHGFHGNWLPA